MANEPAHQSLFESRLARAAAAMRSAGVDLLLLTPGADLFYLTGFSHGHAGERLLALGLRSDGSAQWIAPEMNVPQVREAGLSGRPINAWGDGEGYQSALARLTKDAGAIAFDDEARSAFLLDLISLAPAARIAPAGTIMRGLRIRKGPDELAALRASAAVVDQTIPAALALGRPGVSEEEIDQGLRQLLRRRSPESAVAFTIVGAGVSSALPHHETSGRRVEAGKVVLLDFGTRGPGGYHSDITVTCCLGEPADPEVRRVYHVVHQAQQAALSAARPGATCGQVDEAARAVIRQAGYGDYFLHRTGHGLGLQVHEPPFLAPGSQQPLAPGMVFSVEPGIYLPGRFGVRLEVIATITAEGCGLINQPSAPELPIVPV